MVTENDLTRFREDGYLHVPGLLDPDADLVPLRTEYADTLDRAARDLVKRGEVASARDDLPFDNRLGHLMEESNGALNAYLDIALPQKGVRLDTPMHAGPATFALLRHPHILDAVEAFIGPEIYSNPTQHVRIKPPARRLANTTRVLSEIDTTVWHQDQGTLTPEADGTHLITVWIAVTKATRNNGCLLVAPGSHKRGLALHCHDARANYSRQAIPEHLVGKDRVPLEAKPGDVIFLDKNTMHASLTNRSRSVRWSLDFRYNPIGQPTGRPWFPGFIARSRVAPETELRDPREWANLWREAKKKLVADPPTSFQRWAEDDPGCA